MFSYLSIIKFPKPTLRLFIVNTAVIIDAIILFRTECKMQLYALLNLRDCMLAFIPKAMSLSCFKLMKSQHVFTL